VTKPRAVCLWSVVAATLAGAIWLYTYRVPMTIEFVGHIGQFRYHFLPTEHLREQPWWSVYATVALLLIGGAAIVWLLPDRRRLLSRLPRPFAKPFADIANPSS